MDLAVTAQRAWTPRIFHEISKYSNIYVTIFSRRPAELPPSPQKYRTACTQKRVGRSVSESAGPLPAFHARLARTTQASS